MKPVAAMVIAIFLTAACSGGDGPDRTAGNGAGNGAGLGAPAPPGGTLTPGSGWDLQSSGEGAALALLAGGGRTMLRLFCPAGGRRLLVNVPGFRPVASEERMSFGSGGDSVALVADSNGDPGRGGVSATGPVPGNLAALIGGPVSVNYGAQDSGPHPAPPQHSARAFAAACSEAPPAEPAPPPAAVPPPTASAPAAGACRVQDGKTLPPNLVRAHGNEPFWAARVEGRCVTYSHPENQSGTRIWTQFKGTRDNGVWTGFYDKRRFVLRTRPEPGCSDGMSDNRYPLAVSLTVAGEERTGCAEPL